MVATSLCKRLPIHTPNDHQGETASLVGSRLRHKLDGSWLTSAAQRRLVFTKDTYQKLVAYFHSSGAVGNWETTGYCSSEIQHDSVHFRYLPVLAPLSSGNRWRGGFFEQSLKTMSVTLVTHFTLGPHARNCVERTSRTLNVKKAGSSWGFPTEKLVRAYKAIVRPILNYAGQIWFTKGSSSHLHA